MSFTSTVKNEVSKLEIDSIESITELSAIIKNIGIISDNIKITSENSSVARRIFNLVRNTYHINPKITVRRGFNFNKNYIYILEIQSKINLIIEDLSINNIIPNNYIYDDEGLLKAYLRGLFLSVGSINDPKKSRYHLELLVTNLEYANFVCGLLNKYNLNSKVLKRENKYMIYIKESEKITDFLRIINATNALLYYENIRIYREKKNMINRLNNCEQANVDKIIETASKQVNEIELIEKTTGLDLLDKKTKEAAIYRLKYKETSLVELSEIISMETGNKITKSGLHHRLKKISDIAAKIQNKEL